MHTYANAKGRGRLTIDNRKAFQTLLEKRDAIQGMFATPVNGKSLDISRFAERAVELLSQAANHILGLDDGKKRFADLVLEQAQGLAAA